MTSLEINKIIGAVVATGLVLVVIRTIGNTLVEPGAGPAHNVVVAEATKPKPEAAPAAPAAKETEPVTALLASADVAHGEKVFKKCAACHTAEEGGKNKVGPNLWNIVNAERGAHPDFAYSDAMKAKGGKWTYESLDAFLTKPRDYISGTKMTFSGIKKARDRAAVIAYLRSLSKSPAPLP